jgi:hypothetical protein
MNSSAAPWQTLARGLADSPHTVLQSLADTILDVFGSDSAGISLVTEDGKRFHWPAIAGVWNPHIGGGTPRDFGPCGDVLDRNSPLLFTHFERRYEYFRPVTPLIDECLLVPFYVEGKAVGTIWAITHEAPHNRSSKGRKFDREDLRMLESLGRFTSTAYQVWTALHPKDHEAHALRMQGLSALHQYVHARFREVFGDPSNSAGQDEQWSLDPGPSRASIHVLVDGKAEQPTIWIFDPHDREDGVGNASIAHIQQVDDIIRQIQARMARPAAGKA